MDAHSNFVNEFITDESARNLSDIRHGKTEFIRNQDKHGVLGIIAVQEQLEQRVVIDSAHYVNGELQISGTLHSSGIDSICISARNRGGGPSVWPRRHYQPETASSMERFPAFPKAKKLSTSS